TGSPSSTSTSRAMPEVLATTSAPRGTSSDAVPTQLAATLRRATRSVSTGTGASVASAGFAPASAPDGVQAGRIRAADSNRTPTTARAVGAKVWGVDIGFR